MTCAEWQEKIAAEEIDAGVRAHLAWCGKCAEFARELEANAAALRGSAAPDAAYAAVRARVLAEVRRPRRRWVWAWVGAAAAAIVLAAVLLANPWPATPPPQLSYAATPPRIEAPPPIHAVKRRHTVREAPPRRELARAEQPMTIKLQTADPDVVIYWIVDGKGEAL